MLSPTLATWRLTLHVLAAAIWVGGQFALAGVVPTVRRISPGATRAIARAYSRIAWPAFAVLVVTGIWNLAEVDIADASVEYQVTAFVKVAFAAASGAGAGVHQAARSRVGLAIGGAIGAIAALAALFLGILLRSGACRPREASVSPRGDARSRRRGPLRSRSSRRCNVARGGAASPSRD